MKGDGDLRSVALTILAVHCDYKRTVLRSEHHLWKKLDQQRWAFMGYARFSQGVL